MENGAVKNQKSRFVSSTPAWHIGLQSFLALLIILVIPLSINIKNAVTALKNEVPTKAAVVENKQESRQKASLTKFLAAVVFGVNPDTNVYTNPETGSEHIVLPYGGNIDAGGTLPSTGNIESDRYIYTPSSDGSVPVTTKYYYPLPNAGDSSGGGNVNSGGTIQAGGTILAGGTI